MKFSLTVGTVSWAKNSTQEPEEGPQLGQNIVNVCYSINTEEHCAGTEVIRSYAI